MHVAGLAHLALLSDWVRRRGSAYRVTAYLVGAAAQLTASCVTVTGRAPWAAAGAGHRAPQRDTAGACRQQGGGHRNSFFIIGGGRLPQITPDGRGQSTGDPGRAPIGQRHASRCGRRRVQPQQRLVEVRAVPAARDALCSAMRHQPCAQRARLSQPRRSGAPCALPSARRICSAAKAALYTNAIPRADGPSAPPSAASQSAARLAVRRACRGRRPAGATPGPPPASRHDAERAAGYHGAPMRASAAAQSAARAPRRLTSGRPAGHWNVYVTGAHP